VVLWIEQHQRSQHRRIERRLTAAKIASILTAKNVGQSLILAGASLGADRAFGGIGANADTFDAGTIGAVNIGGNVIAGVIAAGLSSTNATLKDVDDTILGGIASNIRSLSIKGTADPASYFATGKFKANTKIEGANIDPANDLRFLVA
jgi:hypothetical protein